MRGRELRNRLGFIWLAGGRDLQWRRRRFVMAVFATSLVFAITLLLAGFNESFGLEAHRLVDKIDVDGYVVSNTTRGPFMSPRPFSTESVADIAHTKGVTFAAPLVAIVQPDMYLVGFDFSKTHTGASPGQAVVDSRLGLSAGDKVRVGAKGTHGGESDPR